MASSSSQQRISRNYGLGAPRRSQSMFIQRSGLEEPDILKRRARSTRGGRKGRKSTLFAGRSAPKIPQIENSVDLFEKVLSALRDCSDNIKDNIRSSPITAKRALEQKLRWCEDRLNQINGLYEFYKHEIKMRQGARNLETALLSYGVKHGHDKCKSNYRESTQNMCEIEDEFERRIGRFKVTIDALDGFARLCPGDNFEIFLRNGIGRKWKAKCKIERDGQKWTENNIEVKGSLKDGLYLRIFEIKKIQSNAQLGSFSVRLRNYIAARPMSLSIPVNKTGNLKLRVTFHWQPLTTKEESKLKKTNRDGLLSEVFFGSVVNVNHNPDVSTNSAGFPPSSPSVASTCSTNSNPVFGFEEVKYEKHNGNHLNGSACSNSAENLHLKISEAEALDEKYEMLTPEDEIPEENETPESSSLDRLIRKLLTVLNEHKDQHPQLDELCEKLERLDEILQGGRLAKTAISDSVESALESFSFLDLTDVGVKPEPDLQPSDTGYFSSTDETQKSSSPQTTVTQGEPTTVAETTAEQSEEDVEPDTRVVATSPTSLLSSQGTGTDCETETLSCCSELGSTGITIIDKVLQQHLKFCLGLTKDFGSIGPLKCKETSAIIKLEWQCGIIDKLIELAKTKQPPHTISKAYSSLAASGHDEILLFWAGNCGENPLFIESKDFVQGFKNQFSSEVDERYSRVIDRLYPVITTRVLQENGSVLLPNLDEDSVITIYQFTDFFLIDNRWNLVQFVKDVADELLTCSRLMNEEKAVVLTQLQMYNKIPFQQSCCVNVARLLTDPDLRVAGAAGVYFETLLRDGNRRAQAVSYCVEALEDGDEDLRAGACHALERLQGKEVSEHLLFLAKCDTAKVKQAAEAAVVSFGTVSEPSDDEKNAQIWKQTTAMSDVSKSTDF
ncbi:rho family-interacting cell polarization regulator 2-like isoform X2 [Dendronephthya gigantea]|nr:rho family-interacting cell polarization regulator 2-like isoform X2 [Dendronephthya gigantea]